jgi:dynein heavy chain
LIFSEYIRTPENDNTNVILCAKKPKIKPLPKDIAAVSAESSSNIRQTSLRNIIPPILSDKALLKETLSETDSVIDLPVVTETIEKTRAKLDPESPFTFIKFIESHPDTKEFIYMIPAETGKASTIFNPYNLRVVNFAEINTKSSNGVFTMSASGVTHFDSLGHGEFTSLDQWTREHFLFHQLLKISFFSRYRTWKCFTNWKKTILHTKILAAKNKLSQNLFFLHPVLRESLLAIQNANVLITLKKRLVSVEELKNYELPEFVREQKKWIDYAIAVTLQDWETFCKENVTVASKRCLNEKGFDVTLIADLEGGADAEKKLTFTEQAARRGECRRLQRFVKLTDYLIGTTLQMLVVQTVQDLLKFTYRGCTDEDVVVDSYGTGTVILNEMGLVQTQEIPSDADILVDEASALNNMNCGVQVGGVVVGPEIGTERLATCGFDGFSDILCRLVMQVVPQIVLRDVVEEEGPMLDQEIDDVVHTHAPKPKQKEDTLNAKWAKAEFGEAKKFVPLFRTELLVNENDSKRFYFSPSLTEYLGTMDILLKIYLSTVEKFPPLTNSIPFLDPANLAGGAYSAVRGLVVKL